MAESTGIEWCDSTWNPWIGCTKVSPACDDCYAARSTPARAMGIVWGPGQPRHRTAASTWKQPLLWEREHEAFMLAHGRRRRVFCASLADVFDNEVPAEWRHDLFRLILDTPNLDWLLLTKRVGNVRAMLERDQWEHLGNVWLGATVVNQAEADRDIPKLLAVPARVRFLSIEPMLGPIRIPVWRIDRGRPDPYQLGLHWVIAGGESGPHARQSHPDWFRSLRDQCSAAGVPFLFKQWGQWGPVEITREQFLSPPPTREGERIAAGNGEFAFFPAEPRVVVMRWLGKKAAGRLLDGVEHNGFPTP